MSERELAREIVRVDRLAEKASLSETPYSKFWCIAYKTTDLTHNATGSYLYPDLDAEVYDPQGMHSNTVNPSRITVPVAGLYIISWGASFAANATGVRTVSIRKGGSTNLFIQRVINAGAVDTLIGVSGIAKLAANDYIEGGIHQNSGGNLTIYTAAEYSLYLKLALLP